MEGIKDICQDYINRYNISKVGIGCPGDICEGKVLFASNLGWVDFDLYRNLFRVHSKTEGDVLFTLMKNLTAGFRA